MALLVFINAALFCAIALLHFYWAFGGRHFKFTVLPKHAEGQTVFQPGFFSTIVVAVGLVIFAFITLGNLGWFDEFIPHQFIHYATLVIGAIFILRAIGDFKFIGFFKKVKGTDFADNDTRIFSPIALLMGVVSIAIVIWN